MAHFWLSGLWPTNRASCRTYQPCIRNFGTSIRPTRPRGMRWPCEPSAKVRRNVDRPHRTSQCPAFATSSAQNTWKRPARGCLSARSTLIFPSIPPRHDMAATSSAETALPAFYGQHPPQPLAYWAAKALMMPPMSTPTLAYGADFICRHCGAQYVVSYTQLPIADSGSVYCDVCRRQMIQWNSSQEPSYKLVKRPDPK
jgi:hypothetical protein